MKIAVVYISLTGNTEAMANVVVDELKNKGAEVDVFDISSQSFTSVAGYDGIAFGCPAMGDEVLEEDSFEPMFTDIEGQLSGVKIALFGSYGWGDGEWMRSWQDRCNGDGAVLTCEPVITQGDTPADDELKALANSLL